MRIQFLTTLILSAFCATTACAEEIRNDPALNLKLSNLDAFATPGVESAMGDTPLLEIDQIDLWARIRRGYAIPDLQNPLVANQLNWYVRRPDYIQRTTLRASRYLYHVMEELEKRGMPTELALLPFIESAFNPDAYSTAKAAGMWQFIPSTGRDFNLTQNSFRDERRNVIASTDAALTYLQRLYGMFGDWQLALAAYNWGEGSVQRAIKRNQAAGLPIDFNSLSRLMPAETRNYVPKLQAVKNIIADPAQYNLTLPTLENQPYFTSISKTGDIDIKVAAQLAEIPLTEFKALNPQFNRPVITGSETKILLPLENADKFKVNLAQWGRALTSWTTHTITSAREKIDALASKFSTTPEVIREANKIPPKMRLRVGSTILVPKSAAALENTSDTSLEVAGNANMLIEPDVADTRKVTHRVGRRDSLNSIAQRYNVQVAQLKEWNGLQRETVSQGQSLQVHVPNRIARARAGRNTMVAHRPIGKNKIVQVKRNIVQAKHTRAKIRRL
jgi:membrane-bound lytic murein transglycosylase D